MQNRISLPSKSLNEIFCTEMNNSDLADYISSSSLVSAVQQAVQIEYKSGSVHARHYRHIPSYTVAIQLKSPE